MSHSSEADIKRKTTEMVLVVLAGGVEVPILKSSLRSPGENTLAGDHILTGNHYVIYVANLLFTESMMIGEYEDRLAEVRGRIEEEKRRLGIGGGLLVDPRGRA